jgi:hypothetical protein
LGIFSQNGVLPIDFKISDLYGTKTEYNKENKLPHIPLLGVASFYLTFSSRHPDQGDQI